MKSPVVKRSIVVAGHKTSVSLEEAFWNGMKEISGLRNMTLSELVGEIDSEDNWPQRLSGGEQQRLAIARAILDKPDWLFLDEATSALDEKLEAEIYRMLSEVLPDTTIVSIGHRSTLIALHRRHIEMQPGQGGIFEPMPTLLGRAAVITQA